MEDESRALRTPIGQQLSESPWRLAAAGIVGAATVAGDLLLDPMRESIRRFAIPAAAEDVTVVAGALGDRAELMGALALVVGQSEQVLSGRVVGATGR